MSREDCQERWNSRSAEYGLTSIVSSMLCAKNNNGTACFGDSGGKNNVDTFGKELYPKLDVQRILIALPLTVTQSCVVLMGVKFFFWSL